MVTFAELLEGCQDVPDLNDLENRFTYHPPKPGQPEIYERIRLAGLSFALTIDQAAPESRELSLAIMRIEEAVFWANAAIARGPVEAE